MNQKKSITAAIVAGISIAAITTGIIYLTNETRIVDNEGKYAEPTPGWFYSGPFGINKVNYLIGDNIFLTVFGLAPNEKGSIIFLTPDKTVYKTFHFDGSEKSQFNQYFTPKLSSSLNICDADDLVGTWRIVFQGVPYKPITFQIKNEFLSGEEKHYDPEC